jgi:putative Mn2+ efflux pump MntP
VATSLDALAVGASMAFLPGSIWLSAVVIGVVTATFCVVGIGFGGRLGPGWGRWADAAGGSVLLLIGLKTVIKHLAG